MAELVEIPCAPLGKSIEERLQELMDDCKAGKLSSLAFAVVYRDGSTGDGWSALHSRATMIGAVDILKARLLATHMEEND